MEAVSEIVEETIQFHLNQGYLSELVSKLENLECEQSKAKQEREILISEVNKNKETNKKLIRENAELRDELMHLSQIVDQNEQYNRKDTLILSGGGVPPVTPSQTGGNEDPSVTREIMGKVIKEKLGVELKGKITACHRLRKNNRALVKFEDLDDRQKVYEARFSDNNSSQSNRVIIQENLTAKRAALVQRLWQLKESGHITAYHTRNGQVYTRSTQEQRFVTVNPCMSDEQILNTTGLAGRRPQQGSLWRGAAVSGGPRYDTQVKQFMTSQSFSSIPPGNVTGRLHDLAEYVVPGRRGGRGRAAALGRSGRPSGGVA